MSPMIVSAETSDNEQITLSMSPTVSITSREGAIGRLRDRRSAADTDKATTPSSMSWVPVTRSSSSLGPGATADRRAARDHYQLSGGPRPVDLRQARVRRLGPLQPPGQDSAAVSCRPGGLTPAFTGMPAPWLCQKLRAIRWDDPVSGVDRCASAQARPGRVLVVDDQTSFLAVLRHLVCATRELEPVGEAHSGEQAIEVVREIEPDIVLTDVWMPGIGGIAAAREIKAGWPSILIVLISTTHPEEIPLEPDDVLADAVVWKSELDPRLLDDIWLRHRDQHPQAPA